MYTSKTEAKGRKLEFGDDWMDVHLVDGRTLRIPLDWYPRLERATSRQRKNYEFIYDGEAMEWPDIDEHISIEGLLNGNKAPRSLPYLMGVWPEHIQRERERIEKSYQAKKPIPSKRLKTSAAKGAAKKVR